MATYRAPFSHWSDYSFEDLAESSFGWMAEPSRCMELTATLLLTPVTDNSPRQNHIITPQYLAWANQFSYVVDLYYKMNLMRRIEFAGNPDTIPNDLDNIWGKIYEQRRLYGETDEIYRRRLQVYLLQIAGSGTKAAIEEIISIICECPNSCRVDTYWPGLCRIYITNAHARQKARARMDLINFVLPKTLAAGVNYIFYNPYIDLSATINLAGPAYTSLTATELLQGPVLKELQASIFMAIRHDESLAASIRLAWEAKTPLVAREALQGTVKHELEATSVLQATVENSLEATRALMGPVEVTFKAYIRKQAEARGPLVADMLLQGRHIRPIEARILLEAA